VAQVFGTAGKERRRNEMVNLYDEFINWLSYNFPGVELTKYQNAVLEAVLSPQAPLDNKELAQRLKDLLPKSRK